MAGDEAKRAALARLAEAMQAARSAPIFALRPALDRVSVELLALLALMISEE